ncbi:MAG TPA: hypothetical protein VJ952_09225, partial [Opitutales bacterium]|nr:hypothetical protein [Opitutales bacterium]
MIFLNLIADRLLLSDVRTFEKWILRAVVALLLLLAFGVVTSPWWGPAIFKRLAPVVLEKAGFSEVLVSLEYFGPRETELKVDHLRYQGVALADGVLRLRYELRDLWNGRLEQIMIDHPDVTVDLSKGLPTMGRVGRQDEATGPKQALPVGRVRISDASVRLRDEGWSQSFKLDARLSSEEPLLASVTAEGGGIRGHAEVEAVWPDLRGETTISLQVEDPVKWLDFAVERGWLTIPKGYSLDVKSLDVKLNAGFSKTALGAWDCQWLGSGIELSVPQGQFGAEETEFKFRGKGMRIDELQGELSDGRAAYEDLVLSFDALGLSGKEVDQLDAELRNWELKGEPPVDAIGTVSLTAGKLKLASEGSWQVWRPGFSPQALAAKLQVEKAPLSLFTNRGSATGTLQLELAVSAEDPRSLTLSADLWDANLTASGASLESGQLKVSLAGALPGPLEASFGLSDGRLTWSEGAGRLTGLEGDVELKSLLPVTTKGRQSLRFASIEQGAFVAEAGRLQLSYQGDEQADRPLGLEVEADALGGEVRIAAEGRLRAPNSLEIRMFME